MNIRQYKKKYFICKDDNGKMIYAGDTIEIHLPIETKTSYQSVVYWNRIDGAFINAHPTHKLLNHSKHRFLRDFLGKQEYKMWNSSEDDDKTFTMKYSKCIKVKSFYDR